MRGHVKAVGIIHVILGAIGALCGVSFAILGATIANMLGMAVKQAVEQETAAGRISGAEAQEAAGMLGSMMGSMGTAVFAILGVIVLAVSVLSIMTGVGCLKLKSYGRVLAIILGILYSLTVVCLVFNPVSPLLVYAGVGIYSLVIMFNGETAKLFASGGAPAEA